MTENNDKLARFERAEASIKARKEHVKPWPKGVTADDLISEGKDARNAEFLSQALAD